jgi:hypothetical protein
MGFMFVFLTFFSQYGTILYNGKGLALSPFSKNTRKILGGVYLDHRLS